MSYYNAVVIAVLFHISVPSKKMSSNSCLTYFFIGEGLMFAFNEGTNTQ